MFQIHTSVLLIRFSRMFRVDNVTFLPGSLHDNINKFGSSLGYKNAGIALTLAQIPWKSVDDRNAFIESITGKPVQGDDIPDPTQRSTSGTR